MSLLYIQYQLCSTIYLHFIFLLGSNYFIIYIILDFGYEGLIVVSWIRISTMRFLSWSLSKTLTLSVSLCLL